MAFTRFNDATDFNNKGARSLPDQPTISADALKRKFDEDARDVVAPKVNVIVGELEDPTASASLGAVAPTGFSGTTVQAVLNSIASGVGTAVADAHTHSNKMLLDTYTQTETNLADAVTKKHDHSNKSLLDTYEQTEANLADAVSKKHAHSNKAVLDKFSEVSGDPYYDGNPIGGGGGGTWGSITGTLSDQTDLKNALDGKADTSDVPTDVSDLNIDLGCQTASDVSTAVATKSNVAWTQITAASGNTKIATITIDSIPTDVYAPTSGGGGGATSFAGLDDVSLSGSPSAGQIVQYTTVGSDVKLRNVNMPSIPTVTDTYSGTSSDAMSGKAVKQAIDALDATTTGAGTSKTVTALTQTNGVISATYGNISITKSQISDFPVIPDAQIQSDWNQSDTTAKDYIKNKPSNLGHTMIDTVSAIEDLTDGDDDYVVNGYAIKQWSNTDDIQLLVAVSADDDGVGTWEDDDTWETSGVRTGWIQHASLHGIMDDNDVMVEPVFKVPSGNNNAVSAYAMRVDDDITSSLGGVAIKFNAPITANGYVGVRVRHLRTNTIILTP